MILMEFLFWELPTYLGFWMLLFVEGTILLIFLILTHYISYSCLLNVNFSFFFYIYISFSVYYKYILFFLPTLLSCLPYKTVHYHQIRTTKCSNSNLWPLALYTVAVNILMFDCLHAVYMHFLILWGIKHCKTVLYVSWYLWLQQNPMS